MFKRIVAILLTFASLLSVCGFAAGGAMKLGVTKIESEAFSGDVSLTTLTLDEELTYIGSEAFKDCTGLTAIYCFNDALVIEDDAFDGVTDAVVYCNSMSTMDTFAHNKGMTVKYLNAFETACDTPESEASVLLPITWSVVNPMPGRDVKSTFTYKVYREGVAAPVQTTTTTAQELTYTPTVGGNYHVDITMDNELTSTTLSTGKISVASILTMGTFNKKPIQWQVLAVNGKQALVVTKTGLTMGSYFNPSWIKYKYCHWSGSNIGVESTNYKGSAPESSSTRYRQSISHNHVPLSKDETKWGTEADLYYLHARYWCNTTFYESAFTASEKKRILSVTNKNADSPAGVDGGSDTVDRVFFLSYDEVNRYLPTAADRKLGIDWWLRSPGKYRVNAMYVYANGNISTSGSDVGHNNVYYRPAMWIKIGA